MIVTDDMIRYAYFIAIRRTQGYSLVDYRDIAQEVLCRLLKTPEKQSLYWGRLICFLCLNVWREKYTNTTKGKKDITRDKDELEKYGRYFYGDEYVYSGIDPVELLSGRSCHTR